MIGFAIILASTVCGMTNMPFWSSVVCGACLALSAITDRDEHAGRVARLGRSDALALANGASVLTAQLASIGAFAAGWLLAHLLLIS
jgi:hypothetical protein